MATKEQPIQKDGNQDNKKRKIAKDDDVARILAELKEEYADVLAELAK